MARRSVSALCLAAVVATAVAFTSAAAAADPAVGFTSTSARILLKGAGGCGNTCNCPNMDACTSGAAKSACCWTTSTGSVAGACRVGVSSTDGVCVQAPSGLSYSNAVYRQGVPITVNPTINTGGGNVFYTITPSLWVHVPGLFFNTRTGSISGIPFLLVDHKSFTVTATNAVGATHVTITITVMQVPFGLCYSKNPAIYKQGVAITNRLTLVSTGGGGVTFTIAPSLETTVQGLTFDTRTGSISGTPTTLVDHQRFTVTATNAIGAAVITLTITVIAAVQAPSGLSYSNNPAIYKQGDAITTNSATLVSTGGGDVSYTITPSLGTTVPGLIFNTGTGSISGTPTTLVDHQPFTVTAANAVGSAVVTLTITVMRPPSGLTYTNNPAVYRRWGAITNTATVDNGGGQVTYAIDPSLETTVPGLTFDTSSGLIQGTPTAFVDNQPFAITATNAVGATGVTILMTVKRAYSCHSNAQMRGTILDTVTVTDVEGCKVACDANADCKFVDVVDTTCYLLNELTAGEDLYTGPVQGSTVCVQEQPDTDTAGYACGPAGYDFAGSDILSPAFIADSTEQQCAGYCNAIAECTYFVARDNLCFPKKNLLNGGDVYNININGRNCFRAGNF